MLFDLLRSRQLLLFFHLAVQVSPKTTGTGSALSQTLRLYDNGDQASTCARFKTTSPSTFLRRPQHHQTRRRRPRPTAPVQRTTAINTMQPRPTPPAYARTPSPHVTQALQYPPPLPGFQVPPPAALVGGTAPQASTSAAPISAGPAKAGGIKRKAPAPKDKDKEGKKGERKTRSRLACLACKSGVSSPGGAERGADKAVFCRHEAEVRWT